MLNTRAKTPAYGSPQKGIGEGRVCSGMLFNSCANAKVYNEDAVTYADDGTFVCSAEDCDELEEKTDRYFKWNQKKMNKVGLEIEPNKPQAMISGKHAPLVITLGQHAIPNSDTMTFLGITLQKDGKMDVHVTAVVNKIRKASAKIRKFDLLTVSQKKTLMQTWVVLIINYCAASYAPYLNKTHTLKIQRAMNMATRIALNIPWRKRVSFTKLRKKFDILSVEQIVHKALLQEGWTKRAGFTHKRSAEAPNTRSSSQRRALDPVNSSPYICSKITWAINAIPDDIFNESDQKKAFSRIKKLIKKKLDVSEHVTLVLHKLVLKSNLYTC